MKPEIFPINQTVERIESQGVNPEVRSISIDNSEKLVGGTESLDITKVETSSVVSEFTQNNSTPIKSDDDKITTTIAVDASEDCSLLDAADNDNIEKVWISKAKDIIETTKDDPFMREDKVIKLRKTYRTARFGEKGLN